MAKPERHPWPYGPQWNYYPPHMLNFSKIPFSNGPQVNIDPNENYLSIRCPEPRRPYQVPYSSFTSYYHQENRPVRSYLEGNPVYSPKQYLYRPLCQENINNPYKVAENLQSYPACSNYSLTKDQSTCYQTTWNNTSHFQRNPPELDVRHFLATWQDKDDDFVDVSTDNDQAQVYQGNDSIPLDCSKRNSNDKLIRKSYNDSFLSGPALNATGYIVQPYYLKDDSMPLNRPVISEELNNNVLHRNNLNYENNHPSYQKNLYSNTIKFPSSKLLPCEHNMSYSQPLNHCDINSSHLRSSMNPPRQKDLVVDSSERSHYNLTSSLESGELFCDINPRQEEIQKPPVIHPMFNDNVHKMNTADEPCYFGSENNEFSENLMLNDFAPLKDSWDMFSSNLKVKDNTKVSNNSKSVNKVSPQNLYEHLLSNNNNNNATSSNDNNNVTAIAYEGAFNILPNLSSGNQSSTPHNACVLQSHEPIKPNVSSQSHISTKLPTNVSKPIQANTKIRPFQFNEEISSDDIDISIASSGDFLVEEDQPNLCCNSVISFSKMKKEKINTTQQKVLKSNDSCKVDEPHSCPVFNNDSGKNNCLSNVTNEQKNKLNGFSQETEFKSVETEKKACSPENIISSVKGDVMDLSVLKPQNIKDTGAELEKDPMCYLDLSNNYFETSNFEQKTPELREITPVENNVLDISSEKCDIQNKTNEISDIMENSDESSVQESNFPTFDDTLSHISSPDKFLENNNSTIPDKNKSTIPNDNLLLLAHCSQEYGGQIKKESESSEDCTLAVKDIASSESPPKAVRDSVIKCSLRWDRIFNIMSDEVNSQPDMSLDLGPAKVELRLPSDNCSSNHWKIVEADSKIQTSSIVKVKRLILKRKNQPEERIPKMIIRKTEGQEYRSYLKNESNKAVLHCEKLKIYCDKLSKSPQKPSDA